MGWCDAHVTSQSDASKDFHVKEVDCERFVSAEDLIPDIIAVGTKAKKVSRLAWLVALGVYAVAAVCVFAAPSGLGESFILAAVLLILIPVIRNLTQAVAVGISFTHEDKRLIPKVQFLRENDLLSEDDFQNSQAR